LTEKKSRRELKEAGGWRRILMGEDAWMRRQQRMKEIWTNEPGRRELWCIAK
jgi:hypothetical protein